MEKILSQEEINALFATMSSSDVPLGAPGTKPSGIDKQVTRYDFCGSERISKDQIRSLHALHGYFAKNYSSSLSAYLRALVEVDLLSVDQIPYVEFLKLLADPTLYCLVEMQPMNGSVAVEIGPSLVFPMIDILLGGPGSPCPENRTLTEIEMHIVEGIIKLALRDLKEAWRPVMEINPQHEASETRPQMLHFVAPGEAVVAVVFEARLGENAGMINLCIPSGMLKMNRSRFDQQLNPRRAEAGLQDAKKIRRLVKNSTIRLSGAIHDTSFLVEDLLNLENGDIIQLNGRLGDPVILSVGGVPKFSGRIVVKRGKKAFEISGKFNP